MNTKIVVELLNDTNYERWASDMILIAGMGLTLIIDRQRLIQHVHPLRLLQLRQPQCLEPEACPRRVSLKRSQKNSSSGSLDM